MKKDPKDFQIAIIGSGTMGMGIATHFAIYGHKIRLYDAFPEALEKAKKLIPENLKSMQDLDALTADAAGKALGNVSYHTDLADVVAGADMVIECVFENADLKKDIFDKLNQLCGPDVILASNTSSLNIYDIVTVDRPERLIITHFFVPAYVMPLVEIVRGPKTSDAVTDTVYRLMKDSGKNPAVVNKVIPGFIMNRLTFAIFREAAYMVDQGWCRPEDVDAAVVSTHGPRYAFEGPFGLVDAAGVDTYEKISEYLLAELCASPEVPKCLKSLYDAGKMGVKANEGFYTYVDSSDTLAKRSQKIVKMIQAIKSVNDQF